MSGESHANPREVKAIRGIIQGVQSPKNRANRSQAELLAKAANKLNHHQLSPFSSKAFHEAFYIAGNVHARVASNPENANNLTNSFKQALIGLVNLRD